MGMLSPVVCLKCHVSAGLNNETGLELSDRLEIFRGLLLRGF